MSLLNVVSTLATLLSFAMFAAPIPEIRNCARQRSMNKRPFLPFLTLTLNCAIWLLYGWLSHTLAILVTNGFGLVCALYYCSVFLTHDDDAERAKQRQQLSLVAFAVVVLAVFAAVDHVRATPLIGLVASSVSIAVFASPLAQLLNVVRSKSVATLSFPYAVASAVSSGLWSAFGLLAGDGNVYIPNIIAFMLSLAQLSLFLVFGRAAPTGKELAV